MFLFCFLLIRMPFNTPPLHLSRFDRSFHLSLFILIKSTSFSLGNQIFLKLFSIIVFLDLFLPLPLFISQLIIDSSRGATRFSPFNTASFLSFFTHIFFFFFFRFLSLSLFPSF